MWKDMSVTWGGTVTMRWKHQQCREGKQDSLRGRD